MWISNNRWRAPLAVAVLLALSAAAVLGFAGANSAESGDPKLRQAVSRSNAEWLAAMKTGDAATIAAPYADHAVFMFPDGTSVQGRDAIEKMYRSRFEQRGFAETTSIDSKRLEADGDFAYEWGTATVGVRIDGKPVASGGPYLTVWQRQAGGDWKILRNLIF